ncbi:MAG: response regulator [Candidatus Hydrogenedentes bacterium]|nr:response regulator [Candidatus Hydrogenedentota bacterium]
MKILFVENHERFAAVVTREFLTNHEVTTVPSKADALRELDAGRFDVVLVDFDLDDGKGDQLVQQIRAAGNPVPIVAVSSHEHGNAAILAAGANAVCGKIQFNRIDHVLKELVGVEK